MGIKEAAGRERVNSLAGFSYVTERGQSKLSERQR
jgi:hypothetical protein